MRRKDREITDRNEFVHILEKADVCRIAIDSDKAPYIVPLNFGYKWGEHLEIFFHCALEGRKIRLLSKNNSVCFEMDIEHELVKGTEACEWGMKYKSIIGTGKISEITDKTEKKSALDRIMKHYGFTGKNIKYDDANFRKTKILKLVVEEMTGKSC